MDFSEFKTLMYVYHPDLKAVLVDQEEGKRMLASGDWFDSPKSAVDSRKKKSPGRPKKAETRGSDKPNDKQVN